MSLPPLRNFIRHCAQLQALPRAQSSQTLLRLPFFCGSAHVEAHKFFVSDELPRAGLSSAIVKEVVQAALKVIVQDCSALGFSLDHMGVLTRHPPVAEKVV